MEKETIIPLKTKLKCMLGLRFEQMKHMHNGATVARGYYVFFGFYWFCLAFFRRWPLEIQERYATGFIFSYRPTPGLTEGDLMWMKNKKYLRTDYPEDFHHAA